MLCIQVRTDLQTVADCSAGGEGKGSAQVAPDIRILLLSRFIKPLEAFVVKRKERNHIAENAIVVAPVANTWIKIELFESLSLEMANKTPNNCE